MLLFLTAEVQGDEVRARIQSVEPLDEAAARMQRGLRVFLRNEEPHRRRRQAARADAQRPQRRRSEQMAMATAKSAMVLMLQNGSEVEVKLPGRFKVSPQIAGAIKAVTGVVTVEAL